MIKKSFEKTVYEFTEIPELKLRDNFGIYIHVPFCYKKCSFCPFYKELFNRNLKEKYLKAIFTEINRTEYKSGPKWVYIGGGTPNTLNISELGAIIRCLQKKSKLRSIGIELLPSLLSREYIKGLKDIGFTKISLGVESLSETVINKTDRTGLGKEKIKELVDYARTLNLWVNLDMMVGLPEQIPEVFLNDIKNVSDIFPDQITIYPYMIIRGQKPKGYMEDRIQFNLIEQASKLLMPKGYSRKNVWVFAYGNDIYDSSGDELVRDYLGFGPSAFSTFGNWKIVNPELKIYLKNFDNNKKMGLVAKNSKSSNDWRRFAKMIYDLKCINQKELPFYISLFVLILRLFGYSRNGHLTEKGRIFAHEITKTVVESLPFPIQNPNCIKNYNEYVSYSN